MVGPPSQSDNPMLHGNHASSAPKVSPEKSVALRLGWMLGGTLVMAISLMVIAGKPALTFGLSDGVFWAAVLLTGLLRTLDVTRYHGETTSGTPATTTDLKRYLRNLAALSVPCWIAAQAIHL